MKIDIDISKLVIETLNNYPSCTHLQRKFETLLQGHFKVLQSQLEVGYRVGGLSEIKADYEKVLKSHKTNFLQKDWSKFNVFGGENIDEHKAEREIELQFFQLVVDWFEKNMIGKNKITPPTLPVIFTAFANPNGDLTNLTQEQNGIQDALGPLEAKGKIKHLIRTDTDLTAYFDFLQRWKNQIYIFHYAGHANSEALLLQNAVTFFKPLAEELLARNPESLQLVFLNGCSTYSHVQTLFDLGAPAVIASSVPVDDQRAMQLATRFYRHLAAGDNIETAYKSAANFIKAGSTESRFRSLDEIQHWRTISFRQKEPGANFPWGLYVREEGILKDKSLLAFSENIENQSDRTPPEQSITQNAEKIYNIEKIDNANFS